MSRYKRSFDVESVFPGGLELNRLIHGLLQIWPDDLEDSEITATGPRTKEKGFVSGALEIITSRPLTTKELSDMNSFMRDHVSTPFVQKGHVLRKLPPAAKVVTGIPLYVTDVANKSGGNGTIVYSNGTQWCRVSDDLVVREP
jgi:hypothetical protein